MEEQITIQLGSFSNYVGSHFWNFQDEIFGCCANENDDASSSPDMESDSNQNFCQFSQLFRSGKVNGKDVSTPRVLIIDRRGSLGSLNPLSAFDDVDMSATTTQASIDTWDTNNTSIFREDVKEQNAFLKLLHQQDDYFGNSESTSYDKYGRVIPEEDVEERQVNEQNDVQSSEEDVNLKDSDVHAWSDYLKVHMHPASIIELPFWSINEPFSTYAAGKSKSVIGNDSRDEYFDQIRRFAEECDYLRNITVLSDFHDGFGGLVCSMMEEIRDEFPRLTVPVFGFTEVEDSPITSWQRDLEEESVGSLVIPLYNVPLCYSSLSETASVVVPINANAAKLSSPYMRPDASMPYHNSSIVASAIELATGYLRIYDSRVSSCANAQSCYNWANTITCNNRYTFCNMEINSPFPLSLSESIENKSSQNLSVLWSTFDSSSRSSTYFSMNPFMRSLSSAVHGKWSANPNFLSQERAGKPCSNILTIRGSDNEDIPGAFFRNCLGTKYLISQVHQRRLGLPIPNSFPAFFQHVGTNGVMEYSQQQDQCDIANVIFPQSNTSIEENAIFRDNEAALSRAGCITGMASVGCDGLTMGRHMANVRECWSLRPYKARLQLEQVGLSADDCKEIEESLTQLEESYSM